MRVIWIPVCDCHTGLGMAVIYRLFLTEGKELAA